MTGGQLRRLGTLAGMVGPWPPKWPEPTLEQRRLLGRLRARQPRAFVAAMDAYGTARVMILSGPDVRGRLRGREYVLLRDGRMRRTAAGVPYLAVAA